MGTRFVATDECDADIRFKKAYLACKEEDIVIIRSPVGLPGRAIRGKFLEAIARGDKKVFRCPSRCLESCGAREARYCISEALDSARKGDLENGFVFCGANAYRIEAVVSVKQLLAGLRQGFALAGLVSALRTEVERHREGLRALKDEYAATLAGVRGRVRDEKIRIRARLIGIKQEYDLAKARLGELRAELDLLLNASPSLCAATSSAGR